MKFSLYGLLFFFFVKSFNAQIHVKNINDLKKAITGDTLFVVTNDSTEERLYKQAFKNTWTYGPVKFTRKENFWSSVKIGGVYLSNMDYTGAKTFSYYEIYIATASYIKAINKDSSAIVESLAHLAYMPLEKKYFDKTTAPARINFGIVKNNLRQINTAISSGKFHPYYKDFANAEKLRVLKTDTLYIVEDLYHNNKSLRDLVKQSYPFNYKFIQNNELENLVLNTDKQFYYMHFAYSGHTGMQIGIVNSVTGEEVFHDKIWSPIVQLSKDRIELLVKKIEGK